MMWKGDCFGGEPAREKKEKGEGNGWWIYVKQFMYISLKMA
jgi:hypothetical protein